MIIYKRFNQFNQFGGHSKATQLINNGKMWLEENVGSNVNTISKIRPNSYYSSLIWSPVYEWQDLVTEFKKITGDVTLKDVVTITSGVGWTMANSFAHEQSFKPGSMPGDTEVWIIIDNPALAVQFKLAVM